jgi:hypothetical protein
MTAKFCVYAGIRGTTLPWLMALKLSAAVLYGAEIVCCCLKLAACQAELHSALFHHQMQEPAQK